MFFYILSPTKIEAYENKLSDFIADDLFCAIESGDSKIATTKESLNKLKEAFPFYHIYKIEVRYIHVV